MLQGLSLAGIKPEVSEGKACAKAFVHQPCPHFFLFSFEFGGFACVVQGNSWLFGSGVMPGSI